MSISERQKEIRRRRHRRGKLLKLRQKFEKANAAEKATIVEKVRRLTPGADQVFANWGVEEKYL